MYRMSTCFVVAIFALSGTTALAQDHNHDHPDLHIEVELTQLELHGDPVAHNHEHYEFVDVGGGNWVTEHDGLTWPGIGADDGALPPSSTVDLIILGGLEYWDGVSAAGFEPTTDNTHLTVKASAFGATYTVFGNSAQQTLVDFIAVDGGGGVHMHPIWQLFGNSDPADGAYFIEVQVDADGFDPSNHQGIMFHKGLLYEEYEEAVELLGGHGHDHDEPVAEPGAAALLLLGSARLLKRRRS
jgi:hypothetical protein